MTEPVSDTKALLESTAQRLKDAAALAITTRDESAKLVRRGLWLRGLRSVNDKLGKQALRTLPTLTRHMQNEWSRAARERLNGQYQHWQTQLDEVLSRLHIDSSDKRGRRR